MRVIVVHEDGDRSSRVADLLDEVRACVRSGTSRHLGVRVDMRFENDLRGVTAHTERDQP